MRPLELDLVDDALADRLALTRTNNLAQEEIQLNDRYQRALLDNFPFLVWLKDTESRFLAGNRSLADTCGERSPADLIGKSDYDYWPAELAERYRADDQAVMRSGQKKVVTEPIGRTHHLNWFETYKAPVFGDDGKLLGTVGFAQDISDRRRAEEAILLRNAALAGMLRNEPLAGILELIVLSVEAEIPAWRCAIQLYSAGDHALRYLAAPTTYPLLGATVHDLGSPPSIETANAQATIFIIDPERWIVAQSGTTNDASWGRTPSRRVCARVTGMVAADDCVPSAVT